MKFAPVRLCALLFFLSGQTLFLSAQTRIAIGPLWCDKTDPVETALGDAVTDTLALGFDSQSDYTLVDPDRFPDSEAELILYARERQLDYLFFGRLDTIGGRHRLSLGVYNHKNRAVSSSRTVAVPRINDIFAVTDRMQALLMADLTGSARQKYKKPAADYLFAGGNGTPQNPYRITTVYHLVNMDLYPDASYRLMNDLDLSNLEWVPIAELGGEFSGGGHTLSGLTSSRGLFEKTGLFGIIRETGVVKDLTLTGVSLKGRASCGAVAGHNLGVIDNCRVEGAVDGTYFVGGIAGHSGGVISGCRFTGSVSSRLTNTGGITGENQVNGVVTRCLFSGTISNDGKLDRKEDYPDWVLLYPGNSLGGLAGANFGLIRESSAEGTLFCIKDSGGGIAGYNPGKLEHCRFSGSITVKGIFGGLITGLIIKGSASFCFAEGSLVCHSFGGGITGNNEGEIADCIVYRPRVTGQDSAPALRKFASGKAKRYHVITNQKILTDTTRTEYEGWDFNTIWIMTDKGPRLRLETESR